jgi:hypothetical protein
MTPINNSDTAWLIVSDYNQDNSIGFPDNLREDVLNPEISQWYYEWNYSNWIGGGILGMSVGATYGIGSSRPVAVGYNANIGGDSEFNGKSVGGNHHGSDKQQ